MVSRILLVILIIGSVLAAPWKAGLNLTATSTQLSHGTVNHTIPATTAASATPGLPTTTHNSLGSVFSSLTSLFPISLPPDSLNSTLLPAPATSIPAAASSSAPAAASPTSASTASATEIASISIITTTETETKTFFGTISPNGSHTHPPFTGSATSMPTTLQTSTKINGSRISSASSPHGTWNPCLKDPHRLCPYTNNTKGSGNSSSVVQSPSNDFVVKINVSGGIYQGGNPFNSSGIYHGNCTNGVLHTGMGFSSVNTHESCGTDLICLAGLLMASLGSIVTEIMNPTPKGTIPVWCPHGVTETNSSAKTGDMGSGIPWSASETGKWNTSMASGTITQTSGAPSKTSKSPTGAPGIPGKKSTALETSPSTSFSAILNGAAFPMGTGSMITHPVVPTISQRAVKTTKSETLDESQISSELLSALNTAVASLTSTMSPTSHSKEEAWSEWSEWLTAKPKPIPTITEQAVTTAIEYSYPFSLPSLNPTSLSEISVWLKTHTV